MADLCNPLGTQAVPSIRSNPVGGGNLYLATVVRSPLVRAVVLGGEASQRTLISDAFASVRAASTCCSRSPECTDSSERYSGFK